MRFFLREGRVAGFEMLPPGLSDEDAIARDLTLSSKRKGPFDAVDIGMAARIVFKGPLPEETPAAGGMEQSGAGRVDC